MLDIYKDKLSIIANDNLLVQSIKAVFDEEIIKEQETIQPEDNNTLVGEKYRAYEKAKIIIRNAFIEIENYQQGKKLIKKFRKEN